MNECFTQQPLLPIDRPTEVTKQQVVWAYLAVSAMGSLAVTYYYDAADNPKLQTILKWAMRLLGLAAVATSTTLPEASMAAAVGLVGGHALWEAMGRYVPTYRVLPSQNWHRDHHPLFLVLSSYLCFRVCALPIPIIWVHLFINAECVV